jgi:hypothetical protein
MTVKNWAIAGLAAVTFAGPVGAAEQQRVTWPEAIDYVIKHGSACSFVGPVAKSLGLSEGTTVSFRVLSKNGDPKRDFYVTDKAVVLSVTWKSGTNRGYTVSREGLLLKAVDRNTAISLGQAAGGFDAEVYWWIAAISEKRNQRGITLTIDCTS